MLTYLVRGIANGGQYALIAVGYTMVYGILRLINFAHGDLFMVSGMLLIYWVASFPVMPIWLSVLIVCVLTTGLGFAIEKCAYAPLRDAPRMSAMISAIGVSYFLQNLVNYVTGGSVREMPEVPFISEDVELFGVPDKVATFITPIVALVLMAVLVFIVKYTKTGMAMRAVSKDFETSRLMGIKINKIISITFAIGSLLAAVGALLFFTKNTQLKPSAGAMPGLKAFIAAVVGGIGSIPGAVVGAFIIGIVESLAVYFGLSTYKDVFTFALLIFILAVKPTGIFGEKINEKV